jgi:hypothetical protein
MNTEGLSVKLSIAPWSQDQDLLLKPPVTLNLFNVFRGIIFGMC